MCIIPSPSPLIQVRSTGDAGNGCFASTTTSGADNGLERTGIKAGTTVLEATPLVWVVNDEYETRNCRRCLQPASASHQRESSPPAQNCCPTCLRSVICSACAAAAATPYGDGGGDGGGNHEGGAAAVGVSGASVAFHDRLECDTLLRLSALERDQPDLAGSLLGGNTVYLRLFLRLLAMRAGERGVGASPAGARPPQRPNRMEEIPLEDLEDLEDHLEDLLDGGEMEARISNTIRAAKLVAPAAWKANQNTCAEFLGKLYCNSMTVGRAGFSAPLARQGYWSGIRGCLYSDFGVGLFPAGAMFNHSCQPNCSWRTDDSGALHVVAVEDIPSDSQLFISYVDILQPRPVRQDLLLRHFFFQCACPRCRSPSPSRLSSDSPRASPSKKRRSRRVESRREAGDSGRSGSAAGHGGCGDGGGSSSFETMTGSRDASRVDVAEELESGGWICPRRSCRGEGWMLPPLPGAAGVRGHGEGREVGEDGTGEEEMAVGGGGGASSSWRRTCDSCGSVTEEAYFRRWTDLLDARLAEADRDMASGVRVREGRRRLSDLQILCEKRLVPNNAFSLGVHCRLALAAAVDEDWPATGAHAARALDCMRGLLAAVEGSSAPGESRGGRESDGSIARDVEGFKAAADSAFLAVEGGGNEVAAVDGGSSSSSSSSSSGGGSSVRDGSRTRGNTCGITIGADKRRGKRGRYISSADGCGGGVSSDSSLSGHSGSSSGEVGSARRLQATVIWEAILQEVVERALSLARVGYEGNHAESMSTRAVFAERGATKVLDLLGLQRESLVTLSR